MPVKESDDDVKLKVENYGDIFISNSKDEKSKRYVIEFICGLCGEQTKRPKETYKGHCATCCKKTKKTEKPAENKHYYQVMKNLGYTLMYDGIDTINPKKTKLKIKCDCGEEITKTYQIFYQNNKCPGCKKEHVKPENIKYVKSTKKESPPEKTADDIDLPKNYKLCQISKKYFIYLCDNNHANRSQYDTDINCEACSLEKRNDTLRKSDEEIKKILLERNFKLTSVYTNNYNLIEIQCIKCNHFNYRVMDNLIRKNIKCEKCQEINNNTEKLEIKKKLFEKFCMELEHEKYKMNSTNILYIDNTTNFEVICPQNHIFETNQVNFTVRKQRCQECNLEKKSEQNKLSDEKVIDFLQSHHFKLIGKYIDAKTNVDLICTQCENRFSTSLNNIKFNRISCSSCDLYMGESVIINILNINNISFIKDYKFPKFKNMLFDFYLPNLNLIIEFDTIQHSKPIKYFGGQIKYELTRKHDVIKTFHCIKNKIPILRISHQDIENVSEILLPIINNIELEENDYSEENYVIYSNPENYKSFIDDLKKYMEFNS